MDEEKNEIEGIDISNLIEEGLKSNCLSLPGRRVNDEKMIALCEWIRDNGSTLKYINLFGNNITSKGAIKFFNTLNEMKHQSVQTIDLSFNDLNDECMPTIGEFLNGNDSVKYLGLKEMQISDDGIKMLDSSIEKNNCLVELDLSRNRKITDGCVESLQNIIKYTKIRDIFVDDTRIFRAAEAELKNSLLNRLKPGGKSAAKSNMNN